MFLIIIFLYVSFFIIVIFYLSTFPNVFSSDSRVAGVQGMEVINDPEVQAVWVCSPSQFHADQIKAAAKAGKHIFCEKPIATDLKGTIEAVQVLAGRDGGGGGRNVIC